MNLKENKKGQMRGFRGRKGKEKLCNYILISETEISNQNKSINQVCGRAKRQKQHKYFRLGLVLSEHLVPR